MRLIAENVGHRDGTLGVLDGISLAVEDVERAVAMPDGVGDQAHAPRLSRATARRS